MNNLTNNGNQCVLGFIENLKNYIRLNCSTSNDARTFNPIKTVIVTQILQNAELNGWDVTIINDKTIELKKHITDLTYSEKYDDKTFQQMCYNLVSQ